ncbi:MAG: Gfo/Idh/MocA family oxidoreductase [Planctomycetota bacterium]|nr:Gfo/Idh/MocA family oxidoreductase [Planctomycetota bacterium]
MVRIGVVGIGFMGMIHYLAAKKLAGGRVVAICTRDQAKLAGDWTSIHGNFGPSGAQMDLTGISRYNAFEALIADPAVDLVDICLPNEQHAEFAIKALRAGKHVLVEKPISLQLADADAMLAAAAESGRLLMVAHVLPYFPEFAFAAEAVRSGRFGALRGAHLTRLISRPDWSADVADFGRNGGPAIDLHIHDTHFIGLLQGRPQAVRSCGVSDSGVVVHLSTQYLFDEPNVAISSLSGALSMPSRPFTHGFELFLERATLTFAFANIAGTAQLPTPLSILHADGSVEHPLVGSGDPIDAFTFELADAVQSVVDGKVAPALDAALARAALAACQAEVESVRTGRAVELA